jgi:hypothetical protein
MAQVVKKQNNIVIRLPKKLQRTWFKPEILLFETPDTIILKRVEQPLNKLSDVASRISLPKLTQKEIEAEIPTWRKTHIIYTYHMMNESSN